MYCSCTGFKDLFFNSDVSKRNAEALSSSPLEITLILFMAFASGCFMAMIILAISNFVWIYGTMVCTRLVKFMWWCIKTSCSISIECCHTCVSTSGKTCITFNEFALVLSGCLFFLGIVNDVLQHYVCASIEYIVFVSLGFQQSFSHSLDNRVPDGGQ